MAVLTVSQLNFYIKTLMDGDKNLRSVFLKGEISNFTDHYRTGHLYMSIKDEKSAVKAVMFAGNASRLKFHPEEGMKVLVRGYVSVYSVTGQYQMYIEDMQPDGIGALSLAYEQLKKRLEAEGLFDSAHKKPLPAFPQRIGVITSPTGAAVQDICRILGRRYPIGEIIMCPVLVQGENAAAQLTGAIKKFDRLKCADVIIIGRGGGSIEDLWAFNDEALARAIYSCSIPVVSGVGHETDFTICDFVSDVRASTPSAAAELISPEEGELLGNILYFRERLNGGINAMLRNARNRLDAAASSKILRDKTEFIRNKQMQLDMLSGRLSGAYKSIINENKNTFTGLSSRLDNLSPLKVLSRGYTVVNMEDEIITSAGKIHMGDEIDVIFSDGIVKCTVNERKVSDEKSRL